LIRSAPDLFFCIIFYNLFHFIDTFLCSPKEKYPSSFAKATPDAKETAPCAPLLPACPERGRGARLKIFFAMQRK
jgi:hypothetical protein